MSYIPEDEEEEDDGYFSEVLTDADLTGLEPKFVRIQAMETPPSEIARLKVDDLIQMYRDCRDQLASDRKGYKAREARIKTHLSIISMSLRDMGDTLGVDTFSTTAGTAYRNKKEKFTIPRWEELVGYIQSTGNFHILQKRVSPLAVKEIRSTDGSLPDGLESIVEVEFAVRSPTARKRKT